MAESEKENFKFPDEADEKESAESKIEVEIEEEQVEAKAEKEENISKKPPIDPDKVNMAEPTDEELSKYEESVRKRLKRFSKGYHEEKRRAEQAEHERQEAIRFAQQIVEENKRLKSSLGENTKMLVGSVKSKAESDLEAAKKRYKSAYENADADELLAAQEELVAAKLRLDKVNSFKPALQNEDNDVKPEPRFAPAPKADPKATAWQRQNTWFGEDDEMTSLALGLHEKLVKKGVDPTSDEYYEAIDKTMRKRFPEKFEDSEDSEEVVPRAKPSPVVAPATRSTATNKVKLSPRQAEMARKLGVPIELYAQYAVKEMRSQNG